MAACSARCSLPALQGTATHSSLSCQLRASPCRSPCTHTGSQKVWGWREAGTTKCPSWPRQGRCERLTRDSLHCQGHRGAAQHPLAVPESLGCATGMSLLSLGLSTHHLHSWPPALSWPCSGHCPAALMAEKLCQHRCVSAVCKLRVSTDVCKLC